MEYFFIFMKFWSNTGFLYNKNMGHGNNCGQECFCCETSFSIGNVIHLYTWPQKVNS